MWREYVRVVTHARPAMFVIENVDRFKTSYEFQLLLHEVERGELADYDIVYGVLNAADYGVPQRRKRAIVIGSRIAPPDFRLRRIIRTSTGRSGGEQSEML